MQAENYTALVNHQMHTPLLSIIHFVTCLTALLSGFAANSSIVSGVDQANQYCKLILNELYFILAFVEDMLDL